MCFIKSKEDLQNNYKIWNFAEADLKNHSRLPELQGSREGNSYHGNSTRSARTHRLEEYVMIVLDIIQLYTNFLFII